MIEVRTVVVQTARSLCNRAVGF